MREEKSGRGGDQYNAHEWEGEAGSEEEVRRARASASRRLLASPAPSPLSSLLLSSPPASVEEPDQGPAVRAAGSPPRRPRPDGSARGQGGAEEGCRSACRRA
eukprot:765537-Hanusia_phi.AAC.2